MIIIISLSYTVTEMSATMYAQNAVNLRQGPGTEYAKVGNLTKGQQVTVTGQAGNGWYQLDNISIMGIVCRQFFRSSLGNSRHPIIPG